MDTALDLLAAAIRIGTPLAFAALGGILSERAGVFAVGLEGMMLTGAFAGVVLAYMSGCVWLGLAASAAGAVGADPARVRAAAVLACGALAGLGGAVLSLQQVGTFTDAMTNGRGYIALAAIIVGRWMPLATMGGCLLFGLADALQLRVQALRLPVSSYVVQMLPYAVALAVLAGLGRSARLPAALGTPFS